MHACTANLKPAETDQGNQIYSPWEMGTELCCLWRLWAHRPRVPPQHDQAAEAWSWSWIFSCGPLLPRTRRRRRSETFWGQVKEKCQGKQTFTFHLKVDEKPGNHIPRWNFACRYLNLFFFTKVCFLWHRHRHLEKFFSDPLYKFVFNYFFISHIIKMKTFLYLKSGA